MGHFHSYVKLLEAESKLYPHDISFVVGYIPLSPY